MHKLRKHHASAEMEPPFECDYCGIECDDYEALKEHKNRHLNRPDFQCIECDRVMVRKNALKLHMTTHVSQYIARHALYSGNFVKFVTINSYGFDFLILFFS